MRDSYYKEGSWNLSCDWCGEKIKASDARKTWDGFYVCPEHWEPRQPLDFLKGIKDNQNVPFSRPQPPDNFITQLCTINGLSAVPNLAVPGCSIPGRTVILETTDGLPNPIQWDNGNTIWDNGSTIWDIVY